MISWTRTVRLKNIFSTLITKTIGRRQVFLFSHLTYLRQLLYLSRPVQLGIYRPHMNESSELQTSARCDICDISSTQNNQCYHTDLFGKLYKLKPFVRNRGSCRGSIWYTVCGSGGNWDSPVTFAYLIYWRVSCPVAVGFGMDRSDLYLFLFCFLCYLMVK